MPPEQGDLLTKKWVEKSEQRFEAEVGRFLATVLEVGNPDPRDRWKWRVFVHPTGTSLLLADGFAGSLEGAQARCEATAREYLAALLAECREWGWVMRK